MFKKILTACFLVILLSGCVCETINNASAARTISDEQMKKMYAFAQLVDNKYETSLLIDADELSSCMHEREYFAAVVKAAGVSSVALPVVSVESADIEQTAGKNLYDFVIFLNSKGIKTFYLLRESFFINKDKGAEYVWGSANPYASILLKLKEMWHKMPESAEMQTVIIAPEANRWHDKNLNRPAGLVYTWRKNSAANDRLLSKAMRSVFACRGILDLEQMIILVDKEVADASFVNKFCCGTLNDWLKKCDALSVDMQSIETSPTSKNVDPAAKVKDLKSVFVVCPLEMDGNKKYAERLLVLKQNIDAVRKNPACAGIWFRNWNSLDLMWKE